MAKVLLVESIRPSGMKLLNDAGLEVIVSPSTDTETLIKHVQEGVFAIIVRASKLDGRVIDAGNDLKLVVRHGAGYNNIDVAAATRRNIPVVNVPDANTYGVAEYVTGMIIALSRKFFEGDAALRSGKLCQSGASLVGLTSKYKLGGNELPGKCLGIIGLGRIGMKLAEMVHAILDMEIMAYDPFRKEGPSWVRMVSDINEIYREADFISLNALVTKETENMIGEAQLALMKPTAYLINASRGELVDEAALINALKQGKIAGAAIDVFKEEPPQLTNPLLTAPNLILTPHVAGVADEAIEKIAIGAAQAVADFAQGKKLVNVVNPSINKN